MASTLLVGGYQGLAFASQQSPDLTLFALPLAEQLRTLVRYGAPFSFTIMAILLSHEMGHYLTALRHRVRVTLPYFIPFPFLSLSLVGTLGAFILIRSPFPNRRSLLEVGLAGPFAGFLVTLPALVIGIAQSKVGPPGDGGITLGEPLLFRLVSSWFWPNLLPADQVLYLSPVGFAAWFGLLATAINLIPIGQLDGGHATYALFSGGAHRVSRLAFFLLFPMAYFGPNWLIWAFLAYALGIRRPHPPTLDDARPLPRSRKVAGAIGYLTFILCFTPEPIAFSWQELLEGLSGVSGR